jgi:hypothetical protein
MHPKTNVPARKAPGRRVGGAEGAKGCKANFAFIVAQNESVQSRGATIGRIRANFRVVSKFDLAPRQGASSWVVDPKVKTPVKTLG